MNPRTVYFIVPRINRTGGYERQAIAMAQALRRRGTKLEVLTDCEPLAPLENCRTLPARSMLGAYAAFRREFTAAREKGPVVVHLHALYRFSAVGLWAGQQLHLPTILKLPSSTDVQVLFQSPRLSLRLFRPTLQRVSRFLCPSRDVTEQLRAHLRRPEAAVYLPNGVDTRRFSPSDIADQRRQRDDLNIRFGHVILHVGRHVALKGGDVLLKAFAQARQSLPANTGLIFLGQGEQTEAWKRLAEELGVALAVMFAGSHPEPERYYQAADAFVLPSLREGMPNALLEAMACGLPCLASDTGGIRDVFGERFPSQLVPAGDANALAQALPTLFHPGASALGKEMREHVEAHFSIEVISQRLMELYEELLHSPG
jgi:glycosyltransferase involved in cell wall biosynthesis